MKRLLYTLIFVVSLTLAGCATIFGPPLTPGMSVQEVIARKGSPAIEYKDGDTSILEWPSGEWTQYAYMARIGSDGKLISYDQVRTRERFATIKINQFNKNDVLMTIGHPTETSYLSLRKQEVWSYRYKEDGLWNSMMHIYFDTNGIVRGMENGQDPLYLRDNGFGGIGIGGGGIGIGFGF